MHYFYQLLVKKKKLKNHVWSMGQILVHACIISHTVLSNLKINNFTETVGKVFLYSIILGQILKITIKHHMYFYAKH